MKQTITLLGLIFMISNIHSLNNTHMKNDEHLHKIKQQHSTSEPTKDQEHINLLKHHGKYDGAPKHIANKSTTQNNPNRTLVNHNNSLTYQKTKNDVINRHENQSHIEHTILKDHDKSKNHVKDIKIDQADEQKKSQPHETKKKTKISHGNGKHQGVNNKVTNQADDKKFAKHQSLDVTIKNSKHKKHKHGKAKLSKDTKKSHADKNEIANHSNNKPSQSFKNRGDEKSISKDNKNIKTLSKLSKRYGIEHPKKRSKKKIYMKKATKQNNKYLKKTNNQKPSEHGHKNNNKMSKPNVSRRVNRQKTISKTHNRNLMKQLAERNNKTSKKYPRKETEKRNNKINEPNITQTKKSLTKYIEPVINQRKDLNLKKSNHQNSSKVAIEHEFPYMAAVITGQEYLCAGALIDEQWVLTAADKLYSIQGSIYFLRVRLGSINRKKGGQLLSVKYLEIHPYYHSSKPTYDLALIKLSNPVRYSGNLRSVRLQLVPKEITVTHFIVTSWAERSVKSKKSSLIEPILTVVHLHPSDPEECGEELMEINATSDGVMCLDTGVDDTCRRDVGAPVVTNGLLWGLVSSWKPSNCKEEDNVTFVTTMSAKNVTDWVHAIIHGHTMNS